MKKLIALLLALCMVFALCACGTATVTTDATSDAEEAAESVAEETSEDAADAEFTTVEEGELHMATNAAFPPYEMTTDDGDYEGIDVEIASAIADKLGLELVVDDMDFSSVLTAVQQGKADMVLAGLTVTDERKENVDFSDSYATAVQVIIVPEDSDIESADDLEGKTIGCQEGTTGYIYCADEFGEDNVISYTNGATAVQALLAGKVDCVVIDQQPAKEYVKANEGLKILDTAYAEEKYAIAYSKDNTALGEAINAALNELIEDGTVQEIIDKYISADEE